MYSLARKESVEFGVAYAPKGIAFDLVWEGKYETPWKPVTFELREGGFADFQTNDLDWPLCSLELKLLIDRSKGKEDRIEWLSCLISSGSETREYFFLNLDERIDVLDKQKSITANDLVVKPVFKTFAIGTRKVFTYPGAHFQVFITADVKKALDRAGCRGLDYYKRPVV